MTGGACCTVGDRKVHRGYGEVEGRDLFEDVRIMLKWILTKSDRRTWSGLIKYKIGTIKRGPVKTVIKLFCSINVYMLLYDLEFLLKEHAPIVPACSLKKKRKEVHFKICYDSLRGRFLI